MSDFRKNDAPWRRFLDLFLISSNLSRQEDSKLAGAEKEAFKELLDIIKRRNEIWYKAYVWIVRHIGLFVPLPV